MEQTKRTVWSRALYVADQTPESRNRLIDFLRAFSILIVVFGHWLAAVPFVVNGELTLSHALELDDKLHFLTWAIQIMPIFFMVGGYSNALSLKSVYRKGGKRRTWLAARYVRLMTPIIPFLIVWSILVPLLAIGVEPGLLKLASQAAAVPLWFLSVYLLAVALAPWTYKAWLKWRWRTLWVPALAAVVADVFRVNPDWASWATYPSWFNYLFVWMTVHQIGYAWAERGKELSVPQGVVALLVGYAALVLLTVFGPFPVALVGVDSEAISNTTPPSIVLFAQTIIQIGWISVLSGPIRRILSKLNVWAGVVLISGMIMSLYVWHMTAMVLTIGAGTLFGNLGFSIAPLSQTWWLTRPVWFAILAVPLLIFVAIFGRYEQKAGTGESNPRPLALGIGVLISAIGLGSSAAFGIASDEGFPLRWWVPLALIIGTFLTGMFTLFPERSKDQVG